MKIYIAGKITDNPNFKEEFKKAEEFLLKDWHSVMNPSTMNEGFTQEDYLHVCMAMVDVCDAVAFLPNWINSKGAHFEMGYAKAKGKAIRFL